MKKSLILGIVGGAIVLAGTLSLLSVPAFAKSTSAENKNIFQSVFQNIFYPVNNTTSKIVPMSFTINKNGGVTMQGKIISLSSSVNDSADSQSQFVVASWFGNYTVEARNAKIINVAGNSVGYSEMKVGDLVKIQGLASLTGPFITAQSIKYYSSVSSVPTVSSLRGVIVEDQSASIIRSFILVSENTKVRIITNSDVEVIVDGKSTSYDQIKNGMTAVVYGSYNADSSAFIAKRIEATSVTKVGFPKSE